MDEVQQVGFGGIPLGFPLGDGVPDDLRLMGGLVRRLTAVLVILGQGGELLRSLDAKGRQKVSDPFPCLPGTDTGSQEIDGHTEADSQGEDGGSYGIPVDQPSAAAKEGGKDKTNDSELGGHPFGQLFPVSLDGGADFRRLRHCLLSAQPSEVFILHRLLGLGGGFFRFGQGGGALFNFLV